MRPLLVTAAVALGLAACAVPKPIDAPMQERRAAPPPEAPTAGATTSAPADAPSVLPGAWVADEAFGIALARKTGKPMLINFDAAWCAACKDLERQTFPDARIQAALRKVVAIRVDATDDEAPETARLFKKYAVLGLPTLIVLDRSGREVARAIELVTPSKLAAMLEQADR